MRGSIKTERVPFVAHLCPFCLDEAALDQVLNRLSHGRAADFEPLNQTVFRRQLGFWRQAAVSDIGGQNRLDTFVEGCSRHHDNVTSLCLGVKSRFPRFPEGTKV